MIPRTMPKATQICRTSRHSDWHSPTSSSAPRHNNLIRQYRRGSPGLFGNWFRRGAPPAGECASPEIMVRRVRRPPVTRRRLADKSVLRGAPTAGGRASPESVVRRVRRPPVTRRRLVDKSVLWGVPTGELVSLDVRDYPRSWFVWCADRPSPGAGSWATQFSVERRPPVSSSRLMSGLARAAILGKPRSPGPGWNSSSPRYSGERGPTTASDNLCSVVRAVVGRMPASIDPGNLDQLWISASRRQPGATGGKQLRHQSMREPAFRRRTRQHQYRRAQIPQDL